VPDIDFGSDALVYSFYPGPWGGKAIAEVLFGITNPSGKLPASLPRSSGQLPCFYNRKATDSGQRYCDLSAAPLYPFGFGLSYTSFEISYVRADIEDNGSAVNVTFDVSNTGEYSGYAVLMLFIRWLQGDITPREKELKAFSKVWLESGQQKEITLKLYRASLSRWNKDMKFVPGKGQVRLILEEGGTLLWQEEIML
jgi:beta-glucosidase